MYHAMATILLIGGDDDLSNDMSELFMLAGFQVIGSPDSAQEGVFQARRLQPELIVVISTVGLDRSDGLETIHSLLRAAPGSRMIVWSARDSNVYVERVLGVGVSAYVLKNTAYGDLIEVVRRVANGENPGFITNRAHV
jgi:DNA-binding NarL/FixJ family response regulator